MKYNLENIKDIVLSNNKARYYQLGTIEIDTITECKDAQSALYQNLVLKRLDENGVAFLYSGIVDAVVGKYPKTSKQVIEENKAAVSVLSSKSGMNNSYYHSTEGLGVCSQYSLTVQYKELRAHSAFLRGSASMPDDKLPVSIKIRGSVLQTPYLGTSLGTSLACKQTLCGLVYKYSISGAPLARYYRSILKAKEIMASRISPSALREIEYSKLISYNDDVKLPGVSKKKIKEVKTLLNKEEQITVDRNGRVYNLATKISKDIRPAITFDGQPTMALDIIGAHKSIIHWYASKNWNLPEQEVSRLKNINVKFNKQIMLMYLNDKSNKPQYKNINNWLKTNTPVFFEAFNTFKARNIRGNINIVHRLYTRLESEIMNGLADKVHGLGYKTIREHDGVRCIADESDIILEISNEYLAEIGNGFLSMKAKKPEEELQSSKKKERKKMITKIVDMSGYVPSRPKRVWTDEQKKSMASKKAKTYTFQTYTGEIVEVQNLAEFCKDNNLTTTCMYYVAAGMQIQHKGFRLPVAGSTQPLEAPIAPEPIQEVIELPEALIEAPKSIMNSILKEYREMNKEGASLVSSKEVVRLMNIKHPGHETKMTEWVAEGKREFYNKKEEGSL
jgi:hypothetical protein